MKKYPSLKGGVLVALKEFEKKQGVHLGRGVYKIRVRTADLNKGKSGSFRLFVLVIEVDDILIPIAIYFKGDQADMNLKELNDHLDIIRFELQG